MAEHATYFEQGSTVDQAAVWLATLQQRRQNYEEAITNYMIVRPEYPDYQPLFPSRAVLGVRLKARNY